MNRPYYLVFAAALFFGLALGFLTAQDGGRFNSEVALEAGVVTLALGLLLISISGKNRKKD